MVWTSPSKPWDQCDPLRQAALRKAWGTGSLRYKLDPSQQRIYDDIYASHARASVSAERIFCLDVSRQSGKDFMMSVLAVETILRRQGIPTRIPYGAPTKETVHELLVPTMMQIFMDCPPELRPHEIEKGTFRSSSTELNWPKWGGRIVLVGCDLHEAWLRGPATYAIFMTEPAFMPNFDEVFESILMPQMLTQPDGFCVLASTPPDSPGHPWISKYLPDAKKAGMYARRTILDCPRFEPKQVEVMIKKLGGRQSTRVRREFFVEHVVESTLAVVPEFADVKASTVTTEYELPLYRDLYVGLDPGFSHSCGAVFAYLDWHNQRMVIEGDFCVQGLNSKEVARYLKAREWQLWGIEPSKPTNWTDEAWRVELELMRGLFYPGLAVAKRVMSTREGKASPAAPRRVSDTDIRLICDLANDYGVSFSPTAKDDADSALSSLRVNLQTHKYTIHPRCTDLITQLETAIWNKQRTRYAETPTHHNDTIPALVYLNRNVTFNRNPNPPVVHSKQTHHVQPQPYAGSATGRVLGKLWKRW